MRKDTERVHGIVADKARLTKIVTDQHELYTTQFRVYWRLDQNWDLSVCTIIIIVTTEKVSLFPLLTKIIC